jgi:UDP-2,3-diacylglucosamine pyrophosphatase LpxH
MEKERYRTVWISDTHMGSKMTQTQLLIDFLYSVEAENLFLVGDIIDIWALRSSWHWEQRHTNVVRKFLSFAKDGARVIYVPGNHDEAFRDFVGLKFGEIALEREFVCETADGRRLLVLHGDEFDAVIKKAKWVAVVGARVYDSLLTVNRIYNRIRRLIGLDYWSLSGYLKQKTKDVVKIISNYEVALSNAAKVKGYDGVVCGHIHHAEIREINGIMYYNCGDWVESCTALVERFDGTMEILDWSKKPVDAGA